MLWNESHKYEDLEALWLDALAKNPECWMAHNNLGNVYARQGRLEDGVVHYQAALRIEPRLDEPYYSMTVALALLSRTEEAAESFRAALRVNLFPAAYGCARGLPVGDAGGGIPSSREAARRSALRRSHVRATS